MAITFKASHIRLAKTGLAYLGGAFALYWVFQFLTAIFAVFIKRGKSLRSFGPKGSWVVVTGASDGIGKEYAYQLAANGFNVLLISRTQSKLEDISKDIEAKYKVKAEYLAIDFAANRDEDYKEIAASVADKDVAILLNNVGKSHDMPVTFLATEEKEMLDIININCIATLRVTQAVAPGMVSRKRGAILNMGSIAGLTPTPLLATYSGSKSFLANWSVALASELKPHGVHVDLVNSYFVTSAMSKIRRTSVTTPNPKAFVKAALGKIGVNLTNTWGISTPYWSHGVMHWALENLAGLGTSTVVEVNRGMHEDIRKRAIRKKERVAKEN